ncbi:SDR family oxidoreductase [Amnibacterium sp. CER49]|uniref:SDR family NAD(P)-dependent oxidoreductase n=1 Tax=Amnibacterium sp. CER49 TaxID=3039161 RepID=UPI00244BB241|nr:SDR family oxidoreductase [Amnibacterium sp. CER49]MDH2444258.1 SDR family oxidoreductase [Amnibacterium sp. CER49]
MAARTGRTTLITGASSGIGEAFARALAERGEDLVLTARREDRLRALAAELERRHGIRASVLVADLAAEGAVQRLLADLEAAGVVVRGLINNAGFGGHGRFEHEDPQRIAAELAVNVTAPVLLARALLPGMLERGKGYIVNLASTAAFQAVPSMAVYAATKAFVLSFTEALWAETAGRGVRVLALAPGATETEFFEVAGEGGSVGRRQTPEQVVRVALAALDRGRGPSVVSGLLNTLSARSGRLVPRALLTRLAGVMVGDGRR